MRAPPLSVCSGRLSASRPSTLLRFSFHCASALCEASMSSTASSVKMLAISGSKSVSTSSTTSATGGTAGAGGSAPDGKEAGGAATAGATGAGALPGGAAAASAARAAATMRCSSCSVGAVRCAPAARRATGRSRWIRRDARPPTAWPFMQSASSSRSAVSRPTPLSKDLRTQCSSGAVRRMPWRASAMRELPDERVAGAIGFFADDVRRAARPLARRRSAAPRRCSPGFRGCRSRAAADRRSALLRAWTARFLRRRRPARRRPSPRRLRSRLGAARRRRRRSQAFREQPAAWARGRWRRRRRRGACRACAREFPPWRSARSAAPCWRPAHARDRRWPARFAGAALPASSALTSSPAMATRVAHGGENRRRTLQRVFDDLVEQVLDGPGEFG